jgi:hypothetical protein
VASVGASSVAATGVGVHAPSGSRTETATSATGPLQTAAAGLVAWIRMSDTIVPDTRIDVWPAKIVSAARNSTCAVPPSGPNPVPARLNVSGTAAPNEAVFSCGDPSAELAIDTTVGAWKVISSAVPSGVVEPSGNEIRSIVAADEAGPQTAASGLTEVIVVADVIRPWISVSVASAHRASALVMWMVTVPSRGAKFCPLMVSAVGIAAGKMPLPATSVAVGGRKVTSPAAIGLPPGSVTRTSATTWVGPAMTASGLVPVINVSEPIMPVTSIVPSVPPSNGVPALAVKVTFAWSETTCPNPAPVTLKGAEAVPAKVPAVDATGRSDVAGMSVSLHPTPSSRTRPVTR